MNLDDRTSGLDASRSRRPIARRSLLRGAGVGLTGAGAALLFGCGDDDVKRSDTGELETTRIGSFISDGTLCVSPIYLSRDFLPDEGFTDIPQYPFDGSGYPKVADGRVSMAVDFGMSLLQAIDAGQPFSILAGVHTGCYEVFARPGINTIADLTGGVIAFPDTNSSDFMAVVLHFIGLHVDAHTLVAMPGSELSGALQSGKVDAVLALPPFGERLRAANVGRVILSGMEDPPWTQYFCCMVFANRNFVKKNPVATKRALRAFLRAADLIAHDPETAARTLADRKDADDYGEALATFHHLNYGVWRTYNPEDTLRFFAKRMKDAGDLKSSPDQLISKATDWRFVNELKTEMAAVPRHVTLAELANETCGPRQPETDAQAAPRADAIEPSSMEQG